MKKISILLLLFAQALIVLAQAPGGIGNKTGSNGQPKLYMWFIADSAHYNSSTKKVDLWSDESGNGYNLQQTQTDQQPVIVQNAVNGHAAVKFSSEDASGTAGKVVQVLGVGNLSDFPSDSMTVFVVYQTNDAGEGLLSYAVGTNSASNEYLMYNSKSSREYVHGSYRLFGLNFDSDNFTLRTFVWDKSGDSYELKNGGIDSVHKAYSAVSMTQGGYFAVGCDQDDVNGNYDPTQTLDGQIAEIIIYKSRLNSAQRVIVENYLQQKYGLTIKHDYYTLNPSDYVYEMAGVGQMSDGYQLDGDSHGFIVQANTGSLDDNEFILFAHNNVTNAVDSTSSDIPAGVKAIWSRSWFVQKTGDLTARIEFDFSQGIEKDHFAGEYSNYVLLYKASENDNYQIVKHADGVDNGRVYFDLTNDQLQNGIYTLGTTDEKKSPVEGSSGRYWYTLASGNWDDWHIWTLDPSGALPNNPNHYTPSTSPTAKYDKVFILDGKRVTVTSNNKQNAYLRVDGSLDLTNTTGHSFGKIDGNGRIYLQADNFPQGDASGFNAANTGGTVVYYGSGAVLNTKHQFNNVEIDMNSAKAKLVLLADYTILGHLFVEKGDLQINDNSNTTGLNITVHGNLVVSDSGRISVGTANAAHTLTLYSDFTNNGVAKFTNLKSASYDNEATNGYVDVDFVNPVADQKLRCNDTTVFYRIKIKKGSDQTYVLDMEASDPAYFKLLGYAHQSHPNQAQLDDNLNALGLITGTVRIGPNIQIPVLNDVGNYNISQGACLWVDGGEVTKNQGVAIVIYGKLLVTNGKLTSLVNSGLTLRGQGTIEVDGGTVNTRQIRTSVYGSQNQGSYIQNGGIVNVYSVGSYTNYYAFSLPYAGNVFVMHGGILHIFDANGNSSTSGGIFINSDPGNIDVSGGTVVCQIYSKPYPFKITSKAPFYNLYLVNTYDASTHHIVSGGSVKTDDGTVTMDPQPLIVLNNLKIEKNVLLDTKAQDLTVGGDFYISDTAQEQGAKVFSYPNIGLYTSSDADSIYTVTLNGQKDQTFYIGYRKTANNDVGYELNLWNLVINKPADTRVLLKTNPAKDPNNFSDRYKYKNRAIQVKDTLHVISGIFDQGRQSIRAMGEVYVDSKGQLGVYTFGVTNPAAFIILRGGDVTINTEDGAVLGNLKVNSVGTITLTSNVVVKRLGCFSSGWKFNIGKYNLKTDYINEGVTTNNLPLDFGNNNNQIILTNGNASDKGVSLYIPDTVADGTSFVIPIGVNDPNAGRRYSAVKILVYNVKDDGYIQVRPVIGQLQTTNLNGGELMNMYWRVSYSGFSQKPKVKYIFTYSTTYTSGLDTATFVAGKVLDCEPFTRSYEDPGAPDYNSFLGGDKLIIFDGPDGNGFYVDSANYTAGQVDRFKGKVKVFYSYKWAPWGQNKWSDPSIWSLKSHDQYYNPNDSIPGPGDIVRIGYDTRGENSGAGGDYHWIWLDKDNVKIAALIFDNADDGVTWEPRLYIPPTYTVDLGLVQGAGGLVIEVKPPSTKPDITADLGGFVDNDSAYVYYFFQGDGTIKVADFSDYPILRIEGGTNTLGKRTLVITRDIHVHGSLIVDNNAVLKYPNTRGGNILIDKNLYIGGYKAGEVLFNTRGSEHSLTVNGAVYLRGNSNSILTVSNSRPNGLVHTLKVKGDIRIYDGNIDLFTDNSGGNNVQLVLFGQKSSKFTNSTSNLPQFYRIIMDKGTDLTYSFRFANNFSLLGPTDGSPKALELQNGLLILDHPDINITLSSGGSDFPVPASAGLEVKAGKASVTGDDNGIWLDGLLWVNGGTVDLATGNGNGNNYILYTASGHSKLQVDKGLLKVGSQVRRSKNSDAGILDYEQTGGTVLLGAANASNYLNIRGIFEITNPGSKFKFTGGRFVLVNDFRNQPSIASFYFNPDTVDIASTQTIQIGNAQTQASDNQFTLYVNKPVERLFICDSSNTGVSAKLQVVPLTVNSQLLVSKGATFDANGLDINMYGDWLNYGSYLANNNTVRFIGSDLQLIDGKTEFYNLIKSQPNTVQMTDTALVTIDNNFVVSDGVFDTKGGTVFAKGNVENDKLILSSKKSLGVVFNGTEQQTVTGDGSYQRMMIDNPAGVYVPTGNTITVLDSLMLSRGVFDIGKNLLILSKSCSIVPVNPFSKNNMIETNISFTDAGILKHFPAIDTNTPVQFVYPIGCNGKYTPVIFSIKQFYPDDASIRVKAADERHPSIIEDDEAPYPEITDSLNVLQYYWTLKATDVQKFTAKVTMQALKQDVLYQDPPYGPQYYITARLLYSTNGKWDKFSPDDFNENTDELYFYFYQTNDAGISGDYTAGIDSSGFKGAIPDSVQIYVSVKDGLWTDTTLWQPHSPAGGPRGAIVVIKNHVKVPINYTLNFKTIIKQGGVLDLGNTLGHRLGLVTGRGKLYLTSGNLPAGDYDGFFAADSGTVEFGGKGNYDILSEIPYVNNLILSGTGQRNLPNIDLKIYGNLIIQDTADAVNLYSRRLRIYKDLVFDGGSFTAKQGDVAFVGTDPQFIKGPGKFTGNNAFYDLEVANNQGVYVQTVTDVTHNLIFSPGIFFTNADDSLRLTNTDNDIVKNAGDASFVDGPLYKKMIGGTTFSFPVGDYHRYGNLNLTVDNGIATDYWLVQYINHNPGNDGYDPSKYAPPLKSVSTKEYWIVKGPSKATAKVALRWDQQSGVPSTSDDRAKYLKIARWLLNNGTDQWVDDSSDIVQDNGVSSGLIQTHFSQKFNDWSKGNIYTLASSYYAQYIWKGYVSTDWFDPNNWSDKKVPSSIDDAIIEPNSNKRYPDITGDAQVKTLTIDDNAKITIEPGASLTIYDQLINNDTITLKAPNGTGAYPSLITLGKVSGDGAIKAQLFLTVKRYHYVSTPIHDGNANSNLFCRRDGVFDPNFYYYDETTDLNNDPRTSPSGNYDSEYLIKGWKYAHNGSSGSAVQLKVGQGYSFYDDRDRLITFIGKPNTGIQDITGLTYTDNDPVSNSDTLPNMYDGWHLLGNPYPAYLDWNKVAKGLDGVDNAVYVWDGKQYAAYVNGHKAGSGNLSNYIAPMQGFFVHVTEPNASLAINDNCKTHASQKFLKKSADQTQPNTISLKFIAGNYTDYLDIYFNQDATTYFDKKFDAIKLFASSYYTAIPYLYTNHGKLKYAVDALPLNLMDKATIPLGYKIGQEGDYTIALASNTLPSNVHVYFIDKLANVKKLVTSNFTYQFHAQGGENDTRFALEFYRETPPVIHWPWKDTTLLEDHAYFISLDNAIKDQNNDIKTVEFTDQNGQNTSWLAYSSEFNGLYVHPTNSQVGLHHITVAVIDTAGNKTTAQFDIKVLNLNDPPKIIKLLNDTVIPVGNYFQINLNDYFTDIDPGDHLTFAVSSANGSALPAWLHLNASEGLLYGTPDMPDSLKLKVTATDDSNATASQKFELVATELTQTKLNVSNISIYPNPSDGLFIITTDLPLPYDLEILNTNGQIIKKITINQTRKTLDLRSLSKGSYLFRIKAGQKTFTQKVVIY